MSSLSVHGGYAADTYLKAIFLYITEFYAKIFHRVLKEENSASYSAALSTGYLL